MCTFTPVLPIGTDLPGKTSRPMRRAKTVADISTEHVVPLNGRSGQLCLDYTQRSSHLATPFLYVLLPFLSVKGGRQAGGRFFDELRLLSSARLIFISN